MGANLKAKTAVGARHASPWSGQQWARCCAPKQGEACLAPTNGTFRDRFHAHLSLKFAPMGRSPCLPCWWATHIEVRKEGRHGDLPLRAFLYPNSERLRPTPGLTPP